jgi:hypothetical protein
MRRSERGSPPSARTRRRWRAAWPVALALLALPALPPAPAAAAPEVTVRARTSIALEPVRRIPGGVVVSGRVEERATGEPVAYAVVVVRLDDQLVELAADERGQFETRFPIAEGAVDLSVGFGGDRYHSEAREELAGIDVSKRPLTLTVRTDDEVSSGGGAIPVAVIARSDREPASIRAEIFAGDVGADELPRVAVVVTDASGRGSATLDRADLGGPGRKRVEVRFPGNETLDPAATSTTFLVTSTTSLSFALEKDLVRFEGRLQGKGRLTDQAGDGVANATIALWAGDKELRDAVTDERGDFGFAVPAAELGTGRLLVQTVFTSDRPWLESSRSEPVSATVAEAQPVPVGYTLAAFGATCMALVAFVGLRTRPWVRWLARYRSEALREKGATGQDGAAAPVQTGLSLARPSLVSTLRRPSDRGFSGVVRDAVTELPIRGARVRVLHPDLGERATDTGDDGRFDFEELAPGTWETTVRAGGFVSERFEISVPHRGELRNARVDLLPVRERIFSLYKEAAAPLLPEPGLWGIWTPRQIMDHVRERRPTQALSALTDFVEETYFSPRQPEESVLGEAEEHVQAARLEAAGASR